MKPSGFYNLPLAPNGTAQLLVSGEYFKLTSVPTGSVNVKGSFGELSGLMAGQGLENNPFDYLTITNNSANAQTIRIFIGDRNFIDGTTGSVTAYIGSSNRDNYTQNVYTVTPTAVNAITAAQRDYLLIQNKSSSGTVWVNFSTTATRENGLRIYPGDVWESGLSCPQGAVSCIGDIASNQDLLIITGS